MKNCTPTKSPKHNFVNTSTEKSQKKVSQKLFETFHYESVLKEDEVDVKKHLSQKIETR